MNAITKLFEKSSDPKDIQEINYKDGVTLVITKIFPVSKDIEKE